MNEIAENTMAEESVAAEQPEATAENTAGSEEQQESMPAEERSRQAARRRALERRTQELRDNAREEQMRREVLAHPLVKEAMSLLKETRFKQDLARVREAYPQMSAESPQEVGEIYCRLMASGKVDPVVAYEAQIAADRRKNPVPQDMVSAKSAGGDAMYYSSQELDRLTDKDLQDPGIFKKAMASLSKLR